ncbi:MAG TPA: allantoinase AllB [Gaiellaceae bacterium]|jgi:allantoinase
MTVDLLVTGAQIVTEDSTFRGSVAVSAGKIVEVISGDATIDAANVIDATGKVILPGLVDGHVHFNQPGRDHWEGYRTGSMAAAAGGVTTVVDMPLNASPPTTSVERLARKRDVVQSESIVDYAQWGGLVDDNVRQLPGLFAAGVVGCKAFMSSSGTDFERVDDDLLHAGLEAGAEARSLISVHAEDENATALLGQRLRDAGRTDRASWSESRPPSAELDAIRRAIECARSAHGNLHVVHVSIAAGLEEIARARREGVSVTAETCPHYLFFDQSDFERIGPGAKCAPPLRSRDEVDALWDAVLDGLVDTIGSDHSPCLWEDKAKGIEDVWQAWGGISGLQTMLPALLTAGRPRGLTLPALVRMTATSPARLFGLYPRKGAIAPGADADLVVVDPDRQWTLSADQLLYRNRHSAYVGCTFTGAVERTLVRGETVYLDGSITVQPGFGRLLRRNSPSTPLERRAQAGPS